jgi:hypothetical protein
MNIPIPVTYYTAMMLWQPAPRGPPKPYVYQALEFRVGVHLPEEEVPVERMVKYKIC